MSSTGESKEYYFDKLNTGIVKGIAVLFLFCHHLFSDPKVLEEHGIRTLLLSPQQITYLGVFGKVCVCMFTFLTAYGMTKGLQNIEENSANASKDVYFVYSLKRYCSLMGAFLVAYVFSSVLFINKFDYSEIYGRGIRAVYYFIVDLLGLSTLFNSPTLNPTWWYMSLAVILIFFVPALVKLYGQIGRLIIPLGFLTSYFWQLLLPELCYLGIPLFSVAVGICAAKESWIEKICNYRSGSPAGRIIKAVLFIGLFIIFYILRTLFADRAEVVIFVEGVIGLFFSVVSCYISRGLSTLGRLLAFVGKHSANIFFIHTLFIRFYGGVVYYKFTELSLVILFMLSIVSSIFLELIKKHTKYNILIAKMTSRLSLNIKERV